MLIDMQFGLNFDEVKKKFQVVEEKDLSHQPFLNTSRIDFEQRKDALQQSHYHSTSHPSLDLSTFGVLLLPYEKNPATWNIIKDAFETILKRGGRIFLASHLSVYDLSFAPAMIPIYNDLKAKYGDSLQLYIQASEGPAFVYGANQYLEKNFDDVLDEYESEHNKSLAFDEVFDLFTKTYNDFEISQSIKDLSAYDAFRSMHQPNPTTIFKKTITDLQPENVRNLEARPTTK